MPFVRLPLIVVLAGACLVPGWCDVLGRSPAAGRLHADDGEPSSPRDTFHHTVRPLLGQYCVRCHGRTEPEAGLSLAAFENVDDALQSPATWQRVWNAVRRHEMPPEDPAPSADERKRLTQALAELLDRAARDGGREPGHVVIRRLNQVEYNNTVLDLFGAYRPTRTSGGTQFEPQRGMPDRVRTILHREARTLVVTLPPDDVGYGFTNIGEVLSLPPFLLEKYLDAAGHVFEQLAGGGDSRASRRGGGPPVDPQESARRFVERFGRRALGRPLTDDEIARDPAGSAKRFLTAFGRRAFRRPLTGDEIGRYLSLYEAAADRGEPFASALKVPVQAMLVSPYFLFRPELGIEAEERDGLRPLSDDELASRLSYFLWSSMPDEELFRRADAGTLRDLQVLEAQARRMLRHRFSKELGEQFGMQWMGLTGIRAAMPFPDLYPNFYRMRYLPEAMQQEALLLFETILVEDRSVLEFLDPGYAWLNETMIDFYNVDVKADEPPSRIFWQRYELSDRRRGGVLGMGGTMLATSLAARTSPVKRGQWVLDALLGMPPDPPPPGVSELDDAPAAEEHFSLRQRLERHRSDPACASCHRRMDGIGFGLENFDAIGAWRDRDESGPVDARGTLVDGDEFHGVVELKELLVTKYRDDFLRSLTEKMLTYALGRKLEYSDAPAVAQIVERVKRDDYRFSALVVGIVLSEPFHYAQAAAFANEENETKTETKKPQSSRRPQRARELD